MVIPAYRRPEMVERAVRSVLNQSRPPDEVIVVDDASGDATGPRAASLGARVITHEENLGEGGARNSGMRAARHRWVALLDSDDEWLPSHLETLWALRNGHVLIGTAVLATRAGANDHRVFGWAGRRPRVLNGPADVAIPENKLAPSSVMLLRDAALAAGGFRDLRRAADLDLWMRLLEGGTAVAIPRVTALYHLHSGQVSSDQREMDAAHRAVLDAHADRPWCTRKIRLRHEGVIAWDDARAARTRGARIVPTAIALARRLGHPQRAVGTAQLLAGRFRARRLAARLAPGGMPAVAVLPGCAVEPATIPGSVDLRPRTTAGALLHLMRRPPTQAIVSGPIAALVVRALGVDPVTAPRKPEAMT